VVELLLAGVTIGAVASLLAAIRAGERDLEVISKAVASASFVAIGVARWEAGGVVESWLVAGLIACAVGDLLLLGSKTFDLGLASFLLGHMAYAVAFASALPPAEWPLLVIAPIAAAAWLVGHRLWPRLGRRRLPVAAYIATISVMVWGALAVVMAGAMGWQIAAGALLFYLSDLAVARQRFVKPEFINRAIGLPLYYAGQILIAFSI
jgi:uncharacterized membrane protein YhhN